MLPHERDEIAELTKVVAELSDQVGELRDLLRAGYVPPTQHFADHDRRPAAVGGAPAPPAVTDAEEAAEDNFDSQPGAPRSPVIEPETAVTDESDATDRPTDQPSAAQARAERAARLKAKAAAPDDGRGKAANAVAAARAARAQRVAEREKKAKELREK